MIFLGSESSINSTNGCRYNNQFSHENQSLNHCWRGISIIWRWCRSLCTSYGKWVIFIVCIHFLVSKGQDDLRSKELKQVFYIFQNLHWHIITVFLVSVYMYCLSKILLMLCTRFHTSSNKFQSIYWKKNSFLTQSYFKFPFALYFSGSFRLSRWASPSCHRCRCANSVCRCVGTKLFPPGP